MQRQPVPNHVSRRTVLGGLCLGAIGTAVHAVCPMRSAPRAVSRIRTKGKSRLMLDQVNVSEFARHVGTTFDLTLESGERIKVELIEAKGLGTDSRRPMALSKREPFSLLFRVPRGTVLSQRMYTMAHETLGSFELFLVPIGPSGDDLRLEAVFN